jgi:large subunit ribosomal protein L6
MAQRYKPIPIPEKVKVNKGDGVLEVSGPLGSLKLPINPNVNVELVDQTINVTGKDEEAKPFVGLMRSLIRNMIIGVTEGFQKVLQLWGMGYRVQKTKEGIQIFCGFTHPVDFVPPPGITIDTANVPNPDDPKTQITEIIVKGCDKQLVGQVAAQIRAIKPPDSYLGKGIRYKGEVVRKKPGKRAVTEK